MARTAIIQINPRRLFVPYLNREARHATLVVARRHGKSYSLIQDTIVKAMTINRPGPIPRFSYVAPTGSQAKDICWPYIKEFLSNVPGTEWSETELSVKVPNVNPKMPKSLIKLYSGYNYERMRGLYNDGVVIDEADNISPNAWNYVIRPTLADYKGWCTVSGTPVGKGWLYSRMLEAGKDALRYCLVAKASESGIIDPVELAEIREEVGEAAYEQEFEMNFEAPIPGSIYAQALTLIRSRRQICDLVPASTPCWTLWDLGAPLNTSCWTFQIVGSRVLWLHCDGGQDWTITQRVAEMKKRGYVYQGHILPHDGDNTLPGGLSYANELRQAGLDNVMVLPRTNRPEARVLRMISLAPSFWFDRTGCEYGLSALGQYRRRYDAKAKQYTNEAVHDWASHASDSFAYFAEGAELGYLKFSPGMAHHENPRSRRNAQVIIPEGIL